MEPNRRPPAPGLSGLEGGERLWIQYCLFHGMQTLSAKQSNATAQSLRAKGVVAEGEGHFLELPFRIPDALWASLLEHRDEWLPEAVRNDPRFPAMLETFRETLWVNY